MHDREKTHASRYGGVAHAKKFADSKYLAMVRSGIGISLPVGASDEGDSPNRVVPAHRIELWTY